MKKIRALTICYLLFSSVAAQNKSENFLKLTHVFQQGSFPLVKENHATSILIDSAEANVVRSAAHAIASDIELVTTSKPSIITALNNNNRFLIIAGTIGKSVVIDELVKSKKLDILLSCTPRMSNV